jgi:single-stranded DNA-binding protein
MRKGSLILVQGCLRTNRWEDDAGTKRERTQIIVQNVVFGPKKGGREPGEDDDKWEYGEKPTDKSIEEDDDVPF